MFGAKVRQWIAIFACALGVLGLNFLGSRLLAAALIAGPLTVVLVGATARRTPRIYLGLVLGLVCIAIGSSTPSIAAYYFIAASLCGFALPEVLARRPGEGDCYYLLPALFLAILIGIFGIDFWVRDGAGWQEFLAAREVQVSSARAMQSQAIDSLRLSERDIAGWLRADFLLPYRLTGVIAGTFGILFYFALGIFRPWLFPVLEPKNRFAYFKVKEIYAGLFIIAMLALAAWILYPISAVGHLAYGLLFFSAGALALETVSLIAFFASGSEHKSVASGAIVCSAMIFFAILALVAPGAATAVAAVCAMAGLADMWLDFRHLDRILGGVQ